MSAEWKKWPVPAEGEDVDLYHWQDNRCAWCGKSNVTRRLVRDHCHLTGLVRGYLCSSCNSQEGWGPDSIWGGWRTGDNPAHALREYEIYENHLGATPLSPNGALHYYSVYERIAWFELIPQALAKGAPWPEDAPWIDTAVARKEAAYEQVRNAFSDALDGLFPSTRREASA